MADNIAKRIIKLILDKDSAKLVQSEINAVAEKVDSAWLAMAKRVSGFLAGAFAVDKLIEFGREATDVAAKSEISWTRLASAVDASGTSFDSVSEHLRHQAEAFQDATTHGTTEYADALTKLITRSGDTAASINNMGLVANVAAQFFKGDLAEAADVVAKAMNGNVRELHRLNINAKDAQGALDLLSQRSMGAASREAQTFGGHLDQINNLWETFKEEVGNAIIEGNKATDRFDFVSNSIRALTKWVQANKEMISSWVEHGLRFGIYWADIFARAVAGMAYILAGGFSSAIGLASVGIAKLIKGWGALRDIEDTIREKLGEDVTERRKLTKSIQENGAALEEWGKTAFNNAKRRIDLGVNILAKPIVDQEALKGVGADLEFNKPQVGKNAMSKASEDVANAIQQFKEAEKAAQNMQKVLGKSFDAIGAEIDRTTKVLNVLAAHGIAPASVGLGDLNGRLRVLVTQFKPVADAMKKFDDDATAADNSSRVLGDRFDKTGAEIDRTTKLLNALAVAGIDPASIGLGDLGARLTELVTKIKPTEDAAKALARALDVDAKMGALALTHALTPLQQQQQDVLAQIRGLIDRGFSPQSQAIQELVGQYNGLTDAMNAVSAENAVEQLTRQQDDILQSIQQLLVAGLDPASQVITDLEARYNKLTSALGDATRVKDLAEVYKELGDEMRNNLFMATLDGATELDKLQIKQDALKKSMQELLSRGVKPNDRAMQDLAARYKGVTEQIKQQTEVMHLQAAAADFLADALGTALKGGLHEAATQKAKQNAIEAAEMLVRAGAFALFGDFADASKALALAGEFAGIAAAWGALAAVTPSSGGSASAGSAGGSASAASRAASDSGAAKAEQPSTEVSIYLVGPGFNAMNPEVQRVVYGAQQYAEQRYGPNAKVRIGPAT